MGYKAGYCSVEGCGWTSRTHKGLCCAHYQRLKTHGDVRAGVPIVSANKVREIMIGEDCALVPLTQGRFAVVDLCDVELVAGRNWHAVEDNRTFYAATSGQPKQPMHSLILGLRDGLLPDHIDGDGLNNRRSNLRFATPTQNQGNKKVAFSNKVGFKGVREATWATGTKRWRATIFSEGRHQQLGYFYTPEEAASAYDAAALSIFGEFARLNFPEARLG